ncbi:hypothetical protein PMPD1_1339 [Paramixta manurensis]|uniref:Uncharacterized protein n=1 Tax=Paramixta manurensis TaxID=2740817 RepID=A0A6M8U6L2_9GAMM|nr:hypothetical protein PMPD1_1339 [Erwiniaceae bacterium PD-1]
MINQVFTLRLSRYVSEALLPDIRALMPPEAIQFFSNELDEQWHYTLLCQQSDQNCALALSAILVWHQLGRIHTLRYSSPDLTADVSSAGQAQLLGLLNTPGAVLHLS